LRPKHDIHRSRLGLLILAVAGITACGRSEPAYFPLGEGLYYQYGVTVNTVFLEKKSKYVIRTLAPRDLDGRRVYPRAINNDLVYFYSDAQDGVHRVATRRTEGTETIIDDAQKRILPRPLRVGAAWDQETITGVLETVVDPFRRIYRLELPVTMHYTVESLSETVQVPAGTYYDCLKVRGVGATEHKGDPAIRKADVNVDNTDWYAPGVGLVKTFRRETTTNKNLKQGLFRMELEILVRE
jgi:hypothetical protein